MIIKIFIYFLLFENKTSIKRIIADNIISTDLKLSYYIIPTDTDYSITMWIRILEDDQQVSETIILQIQDKNGLFTKIITENLSVIKIRNELNLNNTATTTDWPVPIQNGILDLENKATIYDKWLPFIISKNTLNEVFYSTFPQLQIIKETNRDYNLSGKSFITFTPSNINNVKVLFSDVIFRDKLIDQIPNIHLSIYNNSYLGLYFYTASSNNGKILYNLNQHNEYKNKHFYFQKGFSLLYDDFRFYTNYILYMSNFYDSNVYYICQLFQEMQFLVQANFLNFTLSLPKNYVIYERQLSYQNKYFNFKYSLQFNNIVSFDHTFEESIYYDDNRTQQILQTGQFTRFNETQNYYIKRFFKVEIYSYPQSDFVRRNTLRFQTLQTQFLHDSLHFVNNIYSYYDQITQKCEDDNDMNYIIGALIYKILIYRDTYTEWFPDGTFTYYIVSRGRRVYYHKYDDITDIQFVNFNINSMTEIMEGDLVEFYSTNDLCKDVVNYCMFCVNHKCLKCQQYYYLIDGVCIQCKSDYNIYQNQCIQQSNIYQTNPVQDGFVYDSSKPNIVLSKIKNIGERDTNFNMFIQNYKIIESSLEVQKIQYQIEKFYNPLKIRISNIDAYYTTGFWPQTFNICEPSKVFEIDDQFYVKCVDQCSLGMHLEQKKICLKNFEGCEIQDQNGCQKCLPNFIETSNGSSKICSRQFINISQDYKTDFKTIKANPNMQCKWGDTITSECIDCNPTYFLDKTSLSCIVYTNEFIMIGQQKVCSQYNDPNFIVNCIGTTSSNVVQNTTQQKWNDKCNVLDNFVMNCTSCTLVDYLLNKFSNCIQCLSINQFDGSCSQCPQGYQLINGQCLDQTCLRLTSNCISCDVQNILLCAECKVNYFLVSKNQHFECAQILFCNLLDYQNFNLRCKECQTGYTLLDENLQISLNGIICVQSQSYVENCQEYQLLDSVYQCILCKEFYILISSNFCLKKDKYVDNCLNYDLTTHQCIGCLNQAFICIDYNLNVATTNCIVCLKNNILKKNCLSLNSNMSCKNCLIGFTCLNDTYTISNFDCDQCIDTSTILQGCYQFDIDLNCLQCMNGYTCLDSKYNASFDLCVNCNPQTICTYCLYSTQSINNCILYDMNSNCQQCDFNYVLLDNLFQPCTRNCSYCFSGTSIKTECQMYDINEKCIQCNPNFFCLDQFYNMSRQTCDFCVSNIYLINNCIQYDDSYQCIKCNTNSFEQIILQQLHCIDNTYQIKSCIQYEQVDLTSQYICSLCSDQNLPNNNSCNICQDNEIYFDIQKLCIDESQFIEQCAFYDYNLNCEKCITNYYLIKTHQSNQENQVSCQQYQIEFCGLYYSNGDCFQCVPDYQISLDFQSCISTQNCSYDNCLQNDQQQIKFQTLQDNCLFLIDNCQECQKQDKNLCSQCFQNFYLNENNCLYDCQQDQNYNSIDYQIHCKQQDQLSTLDDICQMVYQGCILCTYSQNKISCIKCSSNYFLQEQICKQIKQILNQECEQPCVQCSNGICNQCPQEFYLQNNVCISTTQIKDDIQCEQEVVCYKNQQIVNQHCKNCRNTCKITQKNDDIIFENNMIINPNFRLSSVNLAGVLDLKNNLIKVKKKDFSTDIWLKLDSKDCIFETKNCTPIYQYVFYYQKNQIENTDILLNQIDNIQQYTPYFTLIFGSQFNATFQLFLEQIKLFWYIDLLDINYGNIYTNFIYKKQASINQVIDQFPINWFKTDFLFRFVYFRDRIELNFIEVNILICYIFKYYYFNYVSTLF